MTPEQHAFLSNPKQSLPKFGQVHDQRTARFVPYDPTRLTYNLQQQILGYVSDPPRTDDDQTTWLTVLTARQMGKSLTAEYAFYPKAAFNPGWDHVCIADQGARADYLHNRVNQLHVNWPEKLRSPTLTTRETRQKRFIHGGMMRTLSAESGAVGIGQSPDSFHASEPAFWEAFADTMSLIYPSMNNRDNALAIFECTPWEAGCDWHEHCLDAKAQRGRHRYVFEPFWDGKLNVRSWDPDDQPDNEELRLYERYHPEGLQWEHLAFRRFTLETDPKIRRNPKLFQVYYPFDDITCWIASARSAIPEHALAKHVASEALQVYLADYQEFIPPTRDGIYVIGVDPSGHAARDHASFQVLSLHSTGWYQAARFTAHMQPLEFTRKLMETGLRYNNALIVVERTGVGEAPLALLEDWNYPNLHYDKPRMPGVPASAQRNEKHLGWLIDALLDELVLHDRSTVEQLQSYKNDKAVEESQRAEIIRGMASRRRRERHHWDAVSALIMAVVAARLEGRRAKDTTPAAVGPAPIHKGLYRFDRQTEKWKEMNRRSKRRDPWNRGKRPR